MSQNIEQCDARFAFECPRHWSELTKTDRENVRLCHVCSEEVYLYTNSNELSENKHKRHCVAITFNLLETVIHAMPATMPGDIEPCITMGILTGDGLQRETQEIVQRMRLLIERDDVPKDSKDKLKDLLDRIETTDA
jgi:hypothetical protein